jgi:hypothetical protein
MTATEPIISTFADLGLPLSLVDALEGAGISAPFPIQALTIPDGINRKELHDGIEKRMREAIEAASAAGAPNVIALAGNRRGMGDE